MRKSFAVISGLLVSYAAFAAEPGSSAESDKPGLLDQVSMGVMATYLDPSDVRDAVAKTAGAALYLGMPLSSFTGWTTELSLAWNELERIDASGHDQLYQLGLDVLRHFPLTPTLTPYVVTGLAVAHEQIRNEDSTRPGLSLGAGLQWNTSYTPLSVRIDARAQAQENDYESDGQPTSGRAVLVDGRFGLGLNWDFGVVANACSPTIGCGNDADSDGILDAQDLCPDSLPSAQVDRTGCERIAARDSDSDGVSDALDQCPATPPGEAVNATGCGDVDAVLLQGVTFELDSDRLTRSAEEILLPIAELLQGGLRDIRIEIAGHADASGSDDYNQALSARRAYAVKTFLSEHGVSIDRMVAAGYGAMRPVADNATAEGRAKNRRVVFRIMK